MVYCNFHLNASTESRLHTHEPTQGQNAPLIRTSRRWVNLYIHIHLITSKIAGLIPKGLPADGTARCLHTYYTVMLFLLKQEVSETDNMLIFFTLHTTAESTQT